MFSQASTSKSRVNKLDRHSERFNQYEQVKSAQVRERSQHSQQTIPLQANRIVNINTANNKVTESESQGSKNKEFRLDNFEKKSQRSDNKSIVEQKTERYNSKLKMRNNVDDANYQSNDPSGNRFSADPRTKQPQTVLFAEGQEGKQAIGSNLFKSRNMGEPTGMFRNNIGTKSTPQMFAYPST